MLKKLQNLLFEDDDEFVEDNTEAEQVSASAPVKPAVQPQVTPVEETAQIPVKPEPVSEIPPVPTIPVEPAPVKTSSVFLDNEPKKSTMINLDDEDSKPVEKKPAVKSEVKREEVKPSKEYRFNPVISPIFGIDEKDMDAVKTTTSKLTEKEKAKFEKNVTPILSPMYGIAVEKPVKPVVKVEESVMTETVKKSEPVKIPSPTIEDEIPEFSLDDILSTRDQEPKQEEDDLFGSTATSEFDFGNDDQLFPNLSFGDLEKETAEDSTTIISRSSLNDHSSHK
ncbi:hypothetical protein [Solobacterium moorei]|uniref:hypothetical protein n=1 Tax=Solobacterium moorei TaxID=102148 RepID=UPI000421D206|nr:hypothetical protein [Solobacterium moorei]BET21562.1 hypothetical protein RGT18_11500 [Solobacterium moorei]